MCKDGEDSSSAIGQSPSSGMNSRPHFFSILGRQALSLVLALPLVLGLAGSNEVYRSLLRLVCQAPGCTLLHCGSDAPSSCCKQEPANSFPSVEQETHGCECCAVESLPAWPESLPANADAGSAASKRLVVSLPFLAPWNAFGQGARIDWKQVLSPPGIASDGHAPSPWSPDRTASKGTRSAAFLGRALI